MLEGRGEIATIPIACPLGDHCHRQAGRFKQAPTLVQAVFAQVVEDRHAQIALEQLPQGGAVGAGEGGQGIEVRRIAQIRQ
jgi:hypothetical protein